MALVLSTVLAPAATLTWSGAGTDYTWINPANWGGIIPTNGDDLVFSGSVRFNSSNSITGLRLNSITYNGSGFTNNGLALTITNGVTDNAGNNTNIIALTLGASQTFANQASGTTLVLNGAIGTTTNGYALTVVGFGDLFLGGVISGNGPVTMNGFGLLRLGGANTFSNASGLTINSGTVKLFNGAAIPSGAGFGNVNMANGAILDLGGNSQTINGLSGLGTVDEASTNAATYTLSVGNGNSNAVFAGTIQNTFGTVALTKIGAGTQTLSGFNSYSGQTIVSQGTLQIASGGSIASANVTIAPGAVFDVVGAGGFTLNGNLIAGRTSGFTNDILGNLTMVTGNITPVAGTPGTLTIGGNLGLSGGTLNFDLSNVATPGSGINDLINVIGTLDLSGGTTAVKLNPLAGSLSGTYTLLTSTNTVVGGPANLSFDAPRGLTATFDTTTQPSNVLMTASGSPNPASIVWAGNGGGGSWDVHASQNWLNNGVPDLFYNLDNVTFNDAAGSANASVSFPGAVSPGAVIVDNSAFNYTLGSGADPGLISGPGSLTKSGTGTATLGTANTFTGNTTINGGTLSLGTSIASPNFILYNGVAPGTLVMGGGGLFMTDAANITYRANFTNVILNPGGGSMAMRNRQSSSSYIYQIGNFTRNVGGTIDFANIQQKASSPQVGLLMVNTNTANSILGGWATIFETDWVVPVATGLGSVNYTAYQTNANPATWSSISNVSLTVNTSANVTTTNINSLKLSGSTVTLNAGQSLTLNTGGLLVPNAGTASAINGGTLLGATNADLIVFEHSGVGALTIGSVIADNTNNIATGGSALTKSGQGTLILTGNNTYTGPTYINGPTVTGGSGSGPAVIAAGTLQIGNGGTSGGISNSPSIADLGTLAFNRSDTIGYSGPISGIGAVKQIGLGTTILTANNAYSGVTTISAGTLQIGNGGATGSISNSVNVANAGTLLFNRTGTIAYSGVISGVGGVTVQGGGTLILYANNTFQGNTTINQSTLVLGPSGSISNSPVISLSSTFDVSAVSGFTLNAANGQQLVGTGVVTGSVATATSTKIIPAGAGVIGSLSFSNNLALNGGTCVMDVSRSADDQILVRGNLALNGGTIQVNVLGAALTNGTYKLILYSGSLSGSAANLAVSGFSQPGQLASLSDATGGEIDLVISTGAGAFLTWDGTGSIWDFSATDWTNSFGVQVPFHHGDNVSFNDAGLANPVVTLGASVDPASVLVNSANPYSFVGSGKITAGASLTKSNVNTLTVLTVNDFSGPTTIAAGAVQLGNGASSGTLGSGNITNNGALFFNEVADVTEPGNISGPGSLTQQGPGGAVILTGINTYNGLTTINGGSTLVVGAGSSAGTLGTGNVQNDGALVVNRSGSLSYGGAIAGAGTVSNIGPGTVTLGGLNTYAGNTVVANGTVRAGGPGAIPNGAGLGIVVMDGGATAAGTLDLNGFNLSINGLSGLTGTVRGQVVNNSGSATNTLTFGGGDSNAVFSGTIRDNSGGLGQIAKLALIKTGAGTQTLDLPTSLGNTYSGGTILSNGVLAITSPGGGTPVNTAANSLALGSGPVTFYGGTLSPAGAFNQNTTPTWDPLNNTLIIPAGQTGTVNAVQRGGINSALLGSGTLLYNPSYQRGTMGGNWTAFTGQIILSGAVNGGQMGLDTALGFPNARVFMNTNVTLYGRLGGTPTIPIGELAGGDDSDSLVSTSPNNAGGLAANFMIGGLNTTTNFNGRIQDTVGIIKVGTGTLTLTNINMSYTGTTTVSNGVLVFTGALPPSSTFGIAAPGQLDISALSPLSVGASSLQTIRGNGTLLGSLVVGPSGVCLPGFTNGIGTMTVTNDINLGGATYMELNRTNASGGTNDQLFSFTMTLGGSLEVTNIGPPLHAGDTFKLIKATTISGAFATTTLPATDANTYLYTWTDNLAANGTITVLTAVLGTNTNPANISVALAGNKLDLSWPLDRTGWQLQTNGVDVSNPADWVMVPGSPTTNHMIFPIDPGQPKLFFRMAYP